MSRKAICLWNGQTVEGEEVCAVEADFSKMTWTFQIDAETRVAAGEYIVISCADLQAAALRAAQGKEDS